MTAHGGPAGIGRTSYVPPESYWTALAREFPKHPVAELRIKSDFRQNAFRASDLPPPRGKAEELLGFRSRVSFSEGMRRLVSWLDGLELRGACADDSRRRAVNPS